MANEYFNFRQFTIRQGRSAFKVGTDAVLLGAAADIAGAERILDVGSGTGILAIMAAQRSQANITAIEPHEGSFADAAVNISSCPWAGRITLLNSRLQDFSLGDNKFDLIIANPPYFSDSLKSPDPGKNAARHNVTLTGNDLLEGAARLLAEGGTIQLIMPRTEGNVFIAEAASFGFYCNRIIKIRPLPSSEVKRLIMKFSRSRTMLHEEFLTIEHGPRHEFTSEYIDLTKDFYLKF
jgi:tRNA1Val (adenine37-N6)-methyltransferase